jgi:glycerol-3-phosphate dehydrogenase
MTEKGWKDNSWLIPNKLWDIIIIGGGITGAGILYEAAASGFDALLIEAKDFSSGTSSRSGKLVHGGIRYIRNKQYAVSYNSVKERESLIKESNGLVKRFPFVYLLLDSDSEPHRKLAQDMFLYELFAGRFGFRTYSQQKMLASFPQLGNTGQSGGILYSEGVADDSRLTLKLIFAAVRQGGHAINYLKVEGLLNNSKGGVCGVAVRDLSPEADGKSAEIKSKVVINATGFLSDEIRAYIGGEPRIRKQRGSHINFPWAKLPIRQALVYYHPHDNRIQFALPWDGITIVGTTDLDENPNIDYLAQEPSISKEEIDYLVFSVNHIFPEAGLSEKDICSTFCGIRPIIKSSSSDPSKESRRHAIWDESGLITIAGGKLTTFRLMADEALKRARIYLKGRSTKMLSKTKFDVNETWKFPEDILNAEGKRRLISRYGNDTTKLLHGADSKEIGRIENTPYLWAELKWAAKNEKIVHLDDLLLRRTRIGLLLKSGGKYLMKHIRDTVASELEWDERRWKQEIDNYNLTWKNYYSPKTGDY